MAIVIPTYKDLFGTDQDALDYYKNLFPLDTKPDSDILSTINLSFMKIEPVFGELRGYEVGEDTVRNEHVKRAVCFESNAIIKANADLSKIASGAINMGSGNANGAVSSEKIDDMAVTYSTSGASSKIGLGDSSLMEVLGILSADAAILLSRYIRKTYNWGREVHTSINIDRFGDA